jgi:hypothetical protein
MMAFPLERRGFTVTSGIRATAGERNVAIKISTKRSIPINPIRGIALEIVILTVSILICSIDSLTAFIASLAAAIASALPSFPASLSAAFALLLVYGPFLLDEGAREGFLYAQKYHAARGGSDIVWTVGSLSRLVRWYLPVFVLLGLGHAVKVSSFARLVGFSFAAVFALQMCAPFPYEDYQVPVMQLLATYAAVKFSGLPDGRGIAVRRRTLLVFALAFACAFGNPLLEKWTTNGQDRFWTRKKAKSELAQLREVARFIESVDPGGKDLLTQDLYLAVESGRSVPKGLEMGPFSDLTDEEWTRLLSGAPCRIAALSGYSFAIEPPVCNERPVEKQMEFWEVLKKNYRLVGREEFFGQNSTTLLILERNEKK